MKKLRILLFPFPGVLTGTPFLAFDRVDNGTFEFEFGRGVSGFVELRLAILGDTRPGVEIPFGGVGGLPVEGFTDI